MPRPIKKVRRLPNNLAGIRTFRGLQDRGKAYTKAEVIAGTGISVYKYNRIELYSEVPLKEVRIKICDFLKVDEKLIWPELKKIRRKNNEENELQ